MCSIWLPSSASLVSLVKPSTLRIWQIKLYDKSAERKLLLRVIAALSPLALLLPALLLLDVLKSSTYTRTQQCGFGLLAGQHAAACRCCLSPLQVWYTVPPPSLVRTELHCFGHCT